MIVLFEMFIERKLNKIKEHFSEHVMSLIFKLNLRYLSALLIMEQSDINKINIILMIVLILIQLIFF